MVPRHMGFSLLPGSEKRANGSLKQLGAAICFTWVETY